MVPRARRAARLIAVLALAAVLGVTACHSRGGPVAAQSTAPQPLPTTPSALPDPPSPSPSPTPVSQLPLGGRTIFPKYRVVAYYGTAGTATMGVLGQSSPEGILGRLRAAAAPYASPGRTVQVAYELIAIVAQAGPGADGSYSRIIDLDQIRRYVDAAARNKVLVVLDVQPGRTDFLTQVKRLRPFLLEPHVGLALDPEWRMGPGEIPGRTIGHVSAAEINGVSAYVSQIVRDYHLPEKLFLLHEFRSTMIPDIANVKHRTGLAMVQHLDGFGTRPEKDATFERLRRPQQFHIGYKLFYRQDIDIYTPRDVLRFRPTPEYVSYQ
jgi:hypothetical protein